MNNLEAAYKEAQHYIMMGTDSFSVRVGDIEIRKIK